MTSQDKQANFISCAFNGSNKVFGRVGPVLYPAGGIVGRQPGSGDQALKKSQFVVVVGGVSDSSGSVRLRYFQGLYCTHLGTTAEPLSILGECWKSSGLQ